MDIEFVRSRFIKHFDGSTGSVYASPGRINLIGEHTDYNGGFVFPGAIDKGMVAELKINGTDKVRAYSIDLKDYVEFGLNEEDAPRASWARYIFGVCREIIKRGGKIAGFNTAFAGDVPLGAGMSSSAALESTYAFALNDMFNCGIDKFELAKIGQATEHNYCGVNCGIMDQFASVFGKAGHLIRLDCRSLEYQRPTQIVRECGCRHTKETPACRVPERCQYVYVRRGKRRGVCRGLYACRICDR